jgi:hypothetical protein
VYSDKFAIVKFDKFFIAILKSYSAPPEDKSSLNKNPKINDKIDNIKNENIKNLDIKSMYILINF